jgi:hypothetical protein
MNCGKIYRFCLRILFLVDIRERSNQILEALLPRRPCVRFDLDILCKLDLGTFYIHLYSETNCLGCMM